MKRLLLTTASLTLAGAAAIAALPANAFWGSWGGPWYGGPWHGGPWWGGGYPGYGWGGYPGYGWGGYPGYGWGGYPGWGGWGHPGYGWGYPYGAMPTVPATPSTSSSDK